MKPFFSLDNYIMTFIVSVNVNVGHWVCYTINKFRDADGIKKQIIFMDSIGGSHNPAITRYLNKITNFDNYDNYVNKLTECYKSQEKLEKFSKYIRDGKYLKLLQFVYKYYSKFTDAEIKTALEKIYTELFKENFNKFARDDLISILTNATPKMKTITKPILLGLLPILQDELAQFTAQLALLTTQNKPLKTTRDKIDIINSRITNLTTIIGKLL